MYLVTAATPFEMQPFLATVPPKGFIELVTGVGPVETTVRLMSFVNAFDGKIKGIVNFGIGGAYIGPAGEPWADLLDICLAENEVLGDFGVCMGNEIERISGKGLEISDSFVMDPCLFEQAGRALEADKIAFHCGNFVTVCCSSGTAARGAMLARQHQGLCENMEGAVVARVCREFDLPCLEVRCISNFVEDRDTSRWKLKQACRRSGEAAAVIVRYLVRNAN